MKTTIILLLASLGAVGQLPAYPCVSIVSIQQDTICTGDTIKLSIFFWPPSPISGQPTNDTTNITFEDQVYNLHAVYRGSYKKFYYLPKQAVTGVPGDTTYFLSLKVPSNFSFTVWNNNPITYGQGSVYTSCYIPGSNQTGTFNYKNCSPAITNTGTTTGIQTYQFTDQAPTYYDMQGNRIDLRYNELIIEQIGQIRRKVVYQPK